MSAAANDRPHYRWRLTRTDGVSMELRFQGGIARTEIEKMYRSCRCEPIGGPILDAPAGDDDEAENATTT